MVTTGFTLAALTGAGFYMVFNKLPRKVRKFMQKHVLFTDTIACLFTYVLFGGTLLGLFASAWMGIIVSSILALTANPVTNDILERFGNKIGQLKDCFIEWADKNAPAPAEQPQLKAV